MDNQNQIPLDYEAEPRKRENSVAGKLSIGFFLTIVIILVPAIIFVIIRISKSPVITEDMLLWNRALFISAWFVSLLGLLSGIIGALSKTYSRSLAIAGIVGNGLIFLLLFFSIIISVGI